MSSAAPGVLPAAACVSRPLPVLSPYGSAIPVHETSVLVNDLALRELKANLIYGTVRLIEKDDETVLAWARDRYVPCAKEELRPRRNVSK